MTAIYQHIRHPRITSRLADRPVKVLDLLPRGTAISRFNTKAAAARVEAATATGVCRFSTWVAGAAAELAVALLLFLILLFPDGRLPSRRWRPVAWALFVVTVGLVTQSLQAGTTISGGRQGPDQAGPSTASAQPSACIR